MYVFHFTKIFYNLKIKIVMKKNIYHSAKIIVLLLFLLSANKLNAQIVSDLIHWTVYDDPGVPPTGWTSNIYNTGLGTWVAPVVGQYATSTNQVAFINTNIGGGAQGIWRNGSGNGDVVYYRGIFTLPNTCLRDSLYITADNYFTVWINGHSVGSGGVWNVVQRILIPDSVLLCDTNVIAVVASDDIGTPVGEGWWMACNLFQNPGTAPVLTAGNNGPVLCCNTLNLTATLTPSSTATYSWTGPHGFTSTLQNPSRANVSILDAGVYTVQAIIAPCCTLTAQTTVVINAGQTCFSTLSVSGKCDSLCFQLLFGHCNCVPRSIGWNFNDPSGVDLGRDCHKFSAPGLYTVTAYYTDYCSQVSYFVNFDITVVDTCCLHQCDISPGFHYSASNPVIFTDVSTSGSGVITGWFWDFGDGTNSSQQNPVHGYSLAGNYTVCLTVIAQMPDGSTCCDQYCKKIEVPDIRLECIVLPDFTYTVDVSNPYLLNFTNTSSGYQTICNISWDFDDPISGPLNISTMLNPNHLFMTQGIHHVCLSIRYCVYDANGNEVTKCDEKICYDVDAGGHHRNRNPNTPSNNIMKQNIPNPFSQTAEVSYELPDNFQTALFVVTDSKGLIVFQRELKTATGTITIDGSKLVAGAYNYEMIVNRRLVESKRMVVIK
jgi:PKD repeat protein